MSRVVVQSLLLTHAAALFFHEKSSIVLTPAVDANISFGFSLGYQHGEHPSLVIGAPLYDSTGRVFQQSISEILSGRTACEPLDIDFTALKINYNRSRSPDQHFYLGASIAATDKFFVTTAPLRTAYGEYRYTNGTIDPVFGAYGACVIYEKSMTARACRDYGLEYFLKQRKTVREYIFGGSGWSSIVDENNQKIILSKSFGVRDVSYGSMDPTESYISMRASMKLPLTTRKEITNFGKAMTLGNYFDKDIKKAYYAFSSRDMKGNGAIDFFCSYREWTPLRFRLEDKSVGSMFGAALCSADVTGDGRAELLVGAPARVLDARNYDRGAVLIYTKSSSVNRKTVVLKLTIWGVKDGARFGTTLSSSDVDGDSFPEIFISAPFENSGVGALYVLCGYEMYVLKDTKTILISELKRTQRIEKETHRSFGFSLQPVSDFNENGSDELGVGAPGNSRVSLFSGVRAITVTVTSKFADTVSTSDSGSSFLDFFSCFTVDLPQKPKIITTKLLVQNVLSGKGTFNNSDEASYEINLATEEGKKRLDNVTEYCKNIHIVDASFCEVVTTVSALENIDDHEEFDGNWVTLSALSELTKSIRFECLCPNTSCAPDLQAEVQWSGSNHTDGTVADYIVGSSQSESVNVVVHNRGTMGCSSCAVVRVSGKLGLQLQCQHTDIDRQYKCALPSPFMGNTAHTIEIQLLMDRLSNHESNLTVDVEVRNNCDETEPGAVTSLIVPYNFTSVVDYVIINGTSMDREISDTEVQDEREEFIFHEQTYTILNNRSFIWKNIGVNIAASNKSYIQNFKVAIQQTEEYAEFNGTKDFLWHRILTLAPFSIIKVTISTTILKKEVEPYLKHGQITISSKLSLDLFPENTKIKQLRTVLTFKSEKTVWQNKTLITIIALVVALLLLVIITAILFKLNFFRRKNKEKLKREIRRRSIRRESSRRRPPDSVEERTLAGKTEQVVEESPSSPCQDEEPRADATRDAPAQHQ